MMNVDTITLKIIWNPVIPCDVCRQVDVMTSDERNCETSRDKMIFWLKSKMHRLVGVICQDTTEFPFLNTIPTHTKGSEQ